MVLAVLFSGLPALDQVQSAARRRTARPCSVSMKRLLARVDVISSAADGASCRRRQQWRRALSRRWWPRRWCLRGALADEIEAEAFSRVDGLREMWPLLEPFARRDAVECVLGGDRARLWSAYTTLSSTPTAWVCCPRAHWDWSVGSAQAHRISPKSNRIGAQRIIRSEPWACLPPPPPHSPRSGSNPAAPARTPLCTLIRGRGSMWRQQRRFPFFKESSVRIGAIRDRSAVRVPGSDLPCSSTANRPLTPTAASTVVLARSPADSDFVAESLALQ